MKKFIVVVLVVLSIFSLNACKKKDKDVNLTECVSYAQTHLYSGEDANFQVMVSIGKKEKLFIADGKVENVADFATVSVVPLNLNLANKTFKFALVADGGEVSGELKRDVVSNAYTANVEFGTFKDKLKSIKIYYDDKTVEVPLSNKLTNMLTWEQVLDIAKKELATEIKGNLDENGKLHREICIKFIRDKRNPASPYFWYVSFIAEDGSYWALLIEPSKGEIITKKV
ncbi:MAG: hypothetical protein RR357_03505 [Clostridia bacterium]